MCKNWPGLHFSSPMVQRTQSTFPLIGPAEISGLTPIGPAQVTTLPEPVAIGGEGMEDFDWSGQESESTSPDAGRVSPSWTAPDANHLKLGSLTPDSCLRGFLHHRLLSLTCFSGSALVVCQASILCLHLHVLHLRPLLLPSVLGKGGSPSSSPGLPGGCY